MGSATRTRPASTPTRPCRDSRTSSSTGMRCGSAASMRSRRAWPAFPNPRTGAAHPPLPPPALHPDLRLQPGRPGQEAAQRGPQGPPDLRGLRVGLRHGYRDPAGPRRPRDPDRQAHAPRPGTAGDRRAHDPGSPRRARTGRPQESRRRVPRPARRPRQRHLRGRRAGLPPLRAPQDLPPSPWRKQDPSAPDPSAVVRVAKPRRNQGEGLGQAAQGQRSRRSTTPGHGNGSDPRQEKPHGPRRHQGTQPASQAGPRQAGHQVEWSGPTSRRAGLRRNPGMWSA